MPKANRATGGFYGAPHPRYVRTRVRSDELRLRPRGIDPPAIDRLNAPALFCTSKWLDGLKLW